MTGTRSGLIGHRRPPSRPCSRVFCFLFIYLFLSLLFTFFWPQFTYFTILYYFTHSLPPIGAKRNKVSFSARGAQPVAPGMSSLEDKLRAQLNVRVRKSTIRKLTLPSAATDFSSNDFLGLAQSPLLRDQFLNLLNRHNSTHSFPLGSGGSRLLDGNSAFAEELESRIATFHRAPAALLCNSGFDANVSVFSSVPQAGDVVIHDELIHASCREGLRLSRATSTMSFLHNDVANLKAQIQAACADNQSLQSGQATLFVAVESVYSMDGDIAPLSSILDVMNQTLPLGNSKLVVDEAHATGVLGPLGAGIVARDSLEDKIFIRIHTFGKALAGNGGKLYNSHILFPLHFLSANITFVIKSHPDRRSYHSIVLARQKLPNQLRSSHHIFNLHVLS